MENDELLKEIARLKEENKSLKEAAKKQEEKFNDHMEEVLADFYVLNVKFDKALLELSAYQEKYKIEHTKIFIPKGEKLGDIVINETEEIHHEEIRAKKTNKDKKYKKKSFDYEKYVTDTRYIYPEEKVCPACGSSLVEASNKVRYVVEVIPSTIKVTKLIKVTMKCPHCNKEDNKIFYPINSDNLTNSILTPSLASFILYHKYELGIPFNHLAKHITNSIGFEITKQNLSNYCIKSCNLLEPIFNRMKEDLLNNQSKVIHSDETTLVVTKKDEENKDRKKSYVYVYASSFYDPKQIRIYDFHESREIESTSKWLDNYNGTIICDSFAGYDKLKKANPNIKLQRCWAHVRRRFADIVKNLSVNQKKESLAYQILDLIGQMFALEKDYHQGKIKYVPSQIVDLRQKDMPPIIDKLTNLVFNANPSPNSALDGAIKYTKNCWNDLFTFLNDGYVEMTNNNAERSVKPFVIQRKVFQTATSYDGATYTGKLFSIIQTCLLNNINVEKYLEYALTNVNKVPVEQLLPYSKEIKILSNN